MKSAARVCVFVTARAFHPDFPPVGFHYPLGNRQPQPRPACFKFDFSGGGQTQFPGLKKLFEGYSTEEVTLIKDKF